MVPNIRITLNEQPIETQDGFPRSNFKNNGNCEDGFEDAGNRSAFTAQSRLQVAITCEIPLQ